MIKTTFLSALFTISLVFLCQTAAALPADRYQIEQRQDHTVRFELTLTWDLLEPDGHQRHGILMNGQFPGPPLHLNEGDTVEFLVHNNLPFAETVHFHGIDQVGTPWSDGVPGLSQRPIKAGHSFLYKWRALQFGTYWYHSHDRSHVMDGLYGPIIIHPARNNPSPFHLVSANSQDISLMQQAETNPEVLMISDWSHFTSKEFIHIEKSANVDNFCVDSVIINGKGAVHCLPQAEINALTSPALSGVLRNYTLTAKGCIPLQPLDGPTGHNYSAIPPTAFDVCQPTTGYTEVIRVNSDQGWVSLNLIASTFINVYTISIDQHPLWIYAVDGYYVTPVQVDALTITIGKRYSVMVKLDQIPGDYTIRLANPGINQILFGTATLSYKGGKPGVQTQPYTNIVGQNTSANVVFFNETTAQPFPPTAPASTMDKSFHLDIKTESKPWEYTLSGIQPFNASLERGTPFLFDPTSTNATNPGLAISTDMGDWVDLIVQIQPPFSPGHSLHKHGNKMWLIGQGSGAFNWSTTSEAMEAVPDLFNLVDPPYGDGFLTLTAIAEPTWTVLRYHVDNPGAWFFHCHIQTHLAGGMAIAILDGVNDFPTVPDQYLHGNGIVAGGFGSNN